MLSMIIANIFCKKSYRLVFLFSISCCCFAQENLYVEGYLFGRQFSTNVDSQLAANMLNNRLDSSVIQLFSEYQNIELDSKTLENISKKYSIDVASLFLIERLYEQPSNKQVQNDYFLLDTIDVSDLYAQLAQLEDFYVVFIPGFRYKGNVGNFLQQRQLLEIAKIPYEMIMIDEVGLVDNNAAMIAERLKEIDKLYQNIIIISVSKGSLETEIALGKLLKPEDITKIGAWINVCGILKGTPIADYWSAPLRKSFLSCGVFFMGKKNININGLLNDMSYTQCKEKYKDIVIPPDIYTINLISTPLGRKKKSTMLQPNDGFSPLLDSITKNGVVIVEVGTNHLFENVNLNTRMVALLQHIANHISTKQLP
jgi:hypothetical protein